MADDARTHEGQAGPPATTDEAEAGTGVRQEPPSLIRESIKYRRHAQEAERRVETLEAEVRALRESREAGSTALERDLAAARAEADALRRDLDTLRADRRLEQAFLKAGCTDPEAAVAVARLRLARQGEPAGPPSGEAGAALPQDVDALVREILSEKPHLAAGPASPGLPPHGAGLKPAGASAVRGAVGRLAEQARQTGRPADVAAYLRARRATGA